jgi:DMSO/TMAO reductase YedYZ molybdopterin-dependent catalytic subunit
MPVVSSDRAGGADRERSRLLKLVVGALVGLVALAAFLGIAELVAVLTGPESAPPIAVGQSAIAHTPEALKEFAIRHFGENDKSVLLIGIYSTLAVLAGIAGATAALTRRLVGLVAVAVLGAVAGVSAVRQPTGGASSVLPSALGALAAGAVFILLLRGPTASDVVSTSSVPNDADVLRSGVSRRQLLFGASLAAASVATFGAGRLLLQRTYSAVASRNAVRLPKPAQPAKAFAGTDEFTVAGLSPFYTSNDVFYRVDTELVVPQVTTDGYQLRIHGLVDRPTTLRFSDLLAMPLIERDITMTCISDPVGGPYIGNARWTGVPLKPLLESLGVSKQADQLFCTSFDGFTVGADLLAALDGRDAMLAVGMNGEPLPLKHGFPVRVMIPGFYGYANACKWVTDLEVTTYAAKQAYWVRRGYATKAPIKLESRIDTPKSFAQVAAGMVPIAGVAWHQRVGVSKVELSVDGGSWHTATLGPQDSVDTWRQWVWRWPATPGQHTIRVRATNANGLVQTDARAKILPNGATGQQSVVMTVT